MKRIRLLALPLASLTLVACQIVGLPTSATETCAASARDYAGAVVGSFTTTVGAIRLLDGLVEPERWPGIAPERPAVLCCAVLHRCGDRQGSAARAERRDSRPLRPNRNRGCRWRGRDGHGRLSRSTAGASTLTAPPTSCGVVRQPNEQEATYDKQSVGSVRTTPSPRPTSRWQAMAERVGRGLHRAEFVRRAAPQVAGWWGCQAAADMSGPLQAGPGAAARRS